MYHIDMKFIFVIGLLFFIVTIFVDNQPVVSADLHTSSTDKLVVDQIDSVDVTAQAYGVFDVETGDLLIGHKENEELPIASITKLFTASEIMKDASLDDVLMVTKEDVETEGRAGKLEAGQEYTVRELLFPLLLESSNDAASVLSETIEDISVGGTVFEDMSGLSQKNKATIVELSKELRDLYVQNPYIFDITNVKQYIGENTGWVNNSPVMDLDGYRGGKHGYTEASNKTLTAVFSETSLADRELGYIILGSDDIRNDLIELRSLVNNSVHLE